MDAQINEMLSAIEKEYGITVVYAVETGSRMWGFASESSDYDIRFIFVQKQERYLTIGEPLQVITKIDGIFDLQGFDIIKATKLISQSNPSIIEWILPQTPHIYKDEGFRQ